ncbi:hypothetical protein J2X04_001697 [Lysobacter niabensis]|uniref:Uncharacterized protein n=1 Tax=Agrilutibacter niabensis TaxID=380628 RepID=A0ABU1VPT4_9GAMM|nr:hypothetical protein [Lysobacter niabensis]MDR7099350.1 hypothetical protein [Lysobacter niabensis]
MATFSDVGPLTYIAPGATHYWSYGWDDTQDHGLLLAGPNVDRNGSAGSPLIAFNQGKQSIIAPSKRYEYYVSVMNVGPSLVLYNLQIGGFE